MINRWTKLTSSANVMSVTKEVKQLIKCTIYGFKSRTSGSWLESRFSCCSRSFRRCRRRRLPSLTDDRWFRKCGCIATTISFSSLSVSKLFVLEDQDRATNKSRSTRESILLWNSRIVISHNCDEKYDLGMTSDVCECLKLEESIEWTLRRFHSLPFNRWSSFVDITKRSSCHASVYFSVQHPSAGHAKR